MLALAVTWQAKPNQEKELARFFRLLQEASRKEPGCLMYIVHQHKSEPQRFFVYEQYRDEAALQAHRSTPHFQEYVGRRLVQVGDRLQGDLYEPI